MAENTQSTPAPAAPVAATPAKKVVIPVGESGGSFSLDAFNRAMGVEVVDEPDVETSESDEAIGSLQDEFKSAPKEEDSEEESDEAEESEEGEEVEKEAGSKDEAAKPSGKAIKAKTADGKEIDIPEDAVILHKVDGELKEINLKEHLNLVAGELTVNQRMGKVASFKEQLDKEREQVFATLKAREDEEKQILEYCAKGNPEAALCYLAEKNGQSPVQLYKQMLAQVAKAYNSFEGKSAAEIENHFLVLETQWMQDQQKKKKDLEAEQTKSQKFAQQVTTTLEQEGINEELFVSVTDQMAKAGELSGKSDVEALDAVIDRALEIKHKNLIHSALSKEIPKALNNKDFVGLLLRYTNPHDFSEAEILKIAKGVLGEETKRIAATLSKKSSPGNARSHSSEKKSEAKPVKKRALRSASDMASAFGL